MGFRLERVCLRCGTTVVGEPAAALTLVLTSSGASLPSRAVEATTRQERVVEPLCLRCGERVWGPLETRLYELLARPSLEAQDG